MENVNNPPGPVLAGENALGIFAKEPVAGRVKTRLCPPLTPAQAADLYRIALAETVQRLSTGPWQTLLFYTGARDYFAQNFPGLPLIPQQGSDLGARMAAALSALLAAGARGAVLVGSDSPDLPPAHLAEAFSRLGDHDAVLAPAADGGYVLIGESRHHPALFRGIPWSSPEVLLRTRERAERCALSLAELPPWEDLDDIHALRNLLERSPACATAGTVRRLLSSLSDHAFQ